MAGLSWLWLAIRLTVFGLVHQGVVRQEMHAHVNYSAQFMLASSNGRLSRFCSAGCLTELGIVHQVVAS